MAASTVAGVLFGSAGACAADSGTVTARRVVFSGNTVVATSALEAIAAPYLARSTSLDELDELRDKLTRHYTDRGYVNSGVVWNGEVADGVLTFAVMEGRLSGISLSGMDRLDPRYVTSRLQRHGDGPLNMEVLRERFQLLLTDPLIARMNARLMPGAQPGEATLDVDVLRARPYQFTAFANNYRPPSIGSNTVGVGGTLRNLTGVGDVLDLTLQAPAQTGAGARTSASWQIPLGVGDTRLSAALDRGRASVVEQPAAALDISSVLSSRDVGVSHAVWESLSQKLSLGLNHVRRENRSMLLGEPYSFTPHEPAGIVKESLWRFWQDYNYRTPTQVIALRSTFSAGHNNLQFVPGLPDADSPSKSFRLWMGQVQWARQVLDNGAQLVLRATVQHSANRLLALDGLSVGGVNTVRGYRENQLVRDQGAYLNLEFDYPLLRHAATSVSLNLVPFIDYGSAQNRGQVRATLSSAGLLTRLTWNGFNFDLALAKRLHHCDLATPDNSTLQDRGIHLQASYKY
ncbi:ShlB/FhaC/HecB family hemolysin secretion/activation protein [Rhodoferax sp.]|uniref:ShlB/FhaC/HecB family hemolysin secretion/activation protein n=1 Tax=Rhodoferax sp. TaxID=50421 RepID=UPI0027552FD5|nr:ShlB/FhaC/HecB family hemolysin secretion/activation protein [Rhodoferax sp.]